MCYLFNDTYVRMELIFVGTYEHCVLVLKNIQHAFSDIQTLDREGYVKELSAHASS